MDDITIEIINDNKLWREELKNDSKLATEEIPNGKTREQVALLSEIKPNKNKENIKNREMKSKKMRQMHPRKLIKTREELEMMNNGLINVRNIPMTNDKEIMNFGDYRRRLKEISVMTYNKTVFYKLKKTRGKWNTPEIEIHGKISMISLIIDVPVTYWFNKSLETNERITAEKMKYKGEARGVTRTEIIMKTMVVRTIRATEFMDHG